jgi:RNA polymerase sigma factor (sigma-70 family)
MPPMNTVLDHLHRTARAADPAAMTDAELLGRFVDRRDAAGFEALVRRHGPMVLGVCRRLLRNDADADDAFQATFLVLVKKATSVVPRAQVGNWLYGVAYQTAVRARALAARRHARERQVAEMPPVEAPPQDLWDDLQPLLDRELSGLPDRYRVPIVLCDLQGKSRKEAARQLGWPEGTVSGRLSRARALLAERLRRRGVVLSASLLGVLLGQHAARAAVPASLLHPTVKAAALLAAGKAAAGGASVQAVALAEGVVKAMLTAKLKIAGIVLLCVAFLGVGASAVLSVAAGRSSPPPTPTFAPKPYGANRGDAYGGAAGPGGEQQDVWTLDFHYESLTAHRVDAPEARTVLCLRYEVTNNTGQPHHFVPSFTLEAPDRPALPDQVLPKLLPEVAKVGGLPDLLECKDSVSITTEQLLPSEPAVKHSVRGAALWPLPDAGARRFSIFVTGLSNAWQAVDPLPPAPEPMIRRKTLRLDFRREGDKIAFVTPAQWLYRTTKAAEGRAEGPPRAEPEQRAAEIKKAEAAVAKLEEQRKNWQKERGQLQDRIRAGDVEDVNRQVELELLNKRLQALRDGPEEGTRGAVLEVFDEKLLLVSLGSEQGIQNGARLAVYRLEPKPVFVGEAEILNVGEKSSVARLTKLLPGQNVRGGDQVSPASRADGGGRQPGPGRNE